MQHHMPELYAGLRRNPMTFPVQYLGANVPQAWAAGSMFFFLQAILGLRPNAPENKLYVDPVLPDWLPDIAIKDLQLGQAEFEIRFWRDGLATRWEVLKGDAGAVVNSSFATRRHLHCNR
jgi:glycogen debranching enzyme